MKPAALAAGTVTTTGPDFDPVSSSNKISTMKLIALAGGTEGQGHWPGRG